MILETIKMNLVGLIPSLPEFRSFYEHGEFLDCSIRVGDYSFPVHRVVLACLCPYFQDHDSIEGYSHQVVKAVIDACYGIPSSIDDPTLQIQTIRLLKFLQIPINSKIFCQMTAEPCQLAPLIQETVGISKETLKHLSRDLRKSCADMTNLKIDRLLCTDSKGNLYWLDQDQVIETWTVGKGMIWTTAYFPERNLVALADCDINHIFFLDASTLCPKKKVKTNGSCFALAGYKDWLAIGLDNGNLIIYQMTNGQMILLPEEEEEKEEKKEEKEDSDDEGGFGGLLVKMMGGGIGSQRPSRISSIIFTDQWLLAANWSGQIRIYQVGTWTHVRTIKIEEGGVYSMTPLPDNQLIISGHNSGVQILNLLTGECIKKVSFEEHAHHDLLDAQTIAVYHKDQIKVMNLPDLTERTTLNHPMEVKRVIPYDQYWVSCGWDNTVKFWDPQTYQLVNSINIPKNVCELLILPE